jgi:hypothetical protein
MGPQDQGPISDYNLYGDLGGTYVYNRGRFADDGGDNRDNVTANLKASYFLNWNGLHEIDFGFDYYKGDRQSRSERSPWGNRTIYSQNVKYDNDPGSPRFGDLMVQPYYIVQSISTDASSSQKRYGLYVNDKWVLNSNWAMQIGLRWDSYNASADDVGSIASSSSISPRLGVAYDIFGDQQWIVKASYSKYASAVPEATTGVVSGSGHPGDIGFMWSNYLSDYENRTFYYLEDVYNMNNWQYNANNLLSYSIPTQNVAINPNLKAPTCDEMVLSATYTFDFDDFGKGYITMAGIKKTWNNLIDYRVGWNGKVNCSYPDILPGYEQELYLIYWDNEPDAKRDFESLELSGGFEKRGWHIYGNYTWSTLKGNYEGELASGTGTGQGLHKLDRYQDEDGNWQTVYDFNDLHPYGYLTGHRPASARVAGDYTSVNRYGKTTFGFRYRFTSGTRWSETRSVPASALSGVFSKSSPDYNELAAIAFGPNFTEYRDNKRNEYGFEAATYQDIAIAHEFNVVKVAGYNVRTYTKLRLDNIFNHQQRTSWNISYPSVPASTSPGEYKNVPWTKGANWGTSTGSSYWGNGRQVEVALGMRF